MSRRECTHWKTCGHDLCILEDDGHLIDSCPDYIDSGYRRPFPREASVVRALLEEKQKRFAQLKSSASGFRFGQGKEAAEEARRWRKSISALKSELRARGFDV